MVGIIDTMSDMASIIPDSVFVAMLVVTGMNSGTCQNNHACNREVA